MSAITPHKGSSAVAVPAADPINSALANAGYLDAVTQGTVNLVSPVFAVDQVADGAKLSIRMVRVCPDRDCYPLPGGKKALLKTALDQIAGAAQVDWAFCGQVDEWNDPHRVKYHAIAIVRNPDGTLRRLPGTKVLDLRKVGDFIGEDAIGMSDRELAMARKHIHSLAESKAKNRAIRSLGIPQAMTEAQVAQPWVVVALVPDMAQPDVRKAMIESFSGNRALLYGHVQHEAPRALPAEIEAGEMNGGDVVSVSDMPEAPTATAMPTIPDPWDIPEPCPLPIPDDVLSRVPVSDEKRMKYLVALNALFTHIVAASGNAEAEGLARKLAAGLDPIKTPLETIGEIGKVLKAEAGGAK